MTPESVPETFLRDIEADHKWLLALGFSEERISRHRDNILRGIDPSDAFADASEGLSLSDEDQASAITMFDYMCLPALIEGHKTNL